MSDDERRRRERDSQREKRRANPEESKRAARDRYLKNNLEQRIRSRVHKALKQQKVPKVVSISGYGIRVSDIASYIGPCPGEREEWHIDHIRPLSSFDLSVPEQVREAFRPENHQWLTAGQNMRKHAKYVP